MKFIDITGNRFLMGDNSQIGFIEDLEGPQVEMTVDDFQMAQTPVTNREFQAFVKATNYITTAEKLGNSFVFELFVPKEHHARYQRVNGATWWLLVDGADWAHPYGPDSSIEQLMDHPVVHVSLADALAFCQWANATLPTEVQWEYAARGGTTTQYPWGETLMNGDEYMANTWQGEFPLKNSADDGFIGTAPVHTYQPNNFGLYQMIGNVWEWCRNPRYVLLSSFKTQKYEIPDTLTGEYAIRGGSFLCHCSYCNRYRVAARNGVDVNSTSSHLSFRCIRENGATQ